MLKTYYELEKFGKGKTWKSGRKLSKSWVENFLSHLYCKGAATTITIKTVLGTLTNFTTQAVQIITNVGGGNNGALLGLQPSINNVSACKDIGIVVGTGTTAVQVNDFKLATQINNGTSTGKLEYFGMIVNDVVTSGTASNFSQERIFRNSSGGSIDVKEIGIQGGWSNNLSANLYATLLCRDVITPVTVSDGQYLKVKYTIQITV